MVWVSLFVVFILLVSLLAGLKEGAVKHFFNLVVVLIAIFIAGLAYRLVAGILSFIPGENWENFLGFFIVFGIVTAILQLAFLLPRGLIQKIWKRGLLYRLLGGALNAVNASIGLVVFARVLSAFPIFDWLARWVAGSSVMSSLVHIFGFIQVLLPEVFKAAGPMV
ncbi:MAG: CvpA family protein [Dehalococcoidia bacterium]|nr:MAG: CvpA family protein [Dehalococcoidia bacterium]